MPTVFAVQLFLLLANLTGTQGYEVTHFLALVALHVRFITAGLSLLLGLAQVRFFALLRIVWCFQIL